MPVRAALPLAVAAAALLLLPAVAAHSESEAPGLRSDVVAAGHAPSVVMPHSQWQGFLQLRPDSNVTAARYQICRVGDTCFAPPTAATAAGNGTFRFDTNGYLANGRPVDYQAGWRLGVKWLLDERLANGTMRTVDFPAGPDLTAPGCEGDAALACNEAHYLAFDMPAASKPAPSLLGSWVAIATLAVAALVRRK